MSLLNILAHITSPGDAQWHEVLGQLRMRSSACVN